MSHSREYLETLDKDVLITIYLRECEVAQAADENFRYGVAELEQQIQNLKTKLEDCQKLLDRELTCEG